MTLSSDANRPPGPPASDRFGGRLRRHFLTGILVVTPAAVAGWVLYRLLAWMVETTDHFRGHCWESRPWRTDARPATWDYTGMTRQREHGEYEPRQLDYTTGLEMKKATRKK